MIVHDGVSYHVERDAARAQLVVESPGSTPLKVFEGTVTAAAGGYRLQGPLTATNAGVVRRLLPWLEPRPLGLATSAGVGDRLGLATPGHVRAFQRFGQGVAPIFAQQSIREMDRTGRSPVEVLNDATFGCVDAGWSDPVGADADHLKSADDIDRCLAAGFSFFTIDPGDHVQDVPTRASPEALSSLPWESLEDDLGSFERRYRDATVDLGAQKLTFEPEAIRRAAVKYAPAVAASVHLYRHLLARADRALDVEVSVDETSEPTTLIEHAYMVLELQRLGVRFVSFAPRYPGRFEKGVDYIGSVDEFAKEFARHAEVAQALGPYKLSLHSGSDKFSVYKATQEATNGLVHLKTAGTSYLEALAVVAQVDPVLFRAIYTESLAAYRQARASYHVSARFEAAPQPDQVADADLPRLLEQHHSRQILHVGFGEVLAAVRKEDGSRTANVLGDQLRTLLSQEAELYAQRLEQHLGRHLAPFAATGGSR